MSMRDRSSYLAVEAPDQKVTVDFLGNGVAVELEVRDGRLCVTAKMDMWEGGDTWKEHEVEWPLPVNDAEEEGADAAFEDD